MIIGLSGKMTAGKDTVAGMLQYLSSDNPYIDYSPKIVVENVLNKSAIMKHSLWENKKFSYKLKQIASLLLGIPIDDLEKQEVKDKVLGEEWWKYYVKYKTKEIVERTDWTSVQRSFNNYLKYLFLMKRQKSLVILFCLMKN
jgi:hypothetical protein